MTSLVIDDEPVVRAIHAAMVGEVTSGPVIAVGSLAEARAVLAHVKPAWVLLDLELGAEDGLLMLPELAALEPPPRTVVVSSHIPRYLDAIRREGSLLCLAKPLTPDLLRAVVGRGRSSSDAMPFTPAEFLQIACLGKHSVELRCRLPDADEDASIVVHDGQVWSAQFGARRGVDAFMAVVAEEHVRVRVRALEGPPPPRDVAGGWEALLLEAMRRHDEREARRRIDFSSEISEAFAALVTESEPLAE